MEFNCCEKSPKGDGIGQIADVLKVLAEQNRLKIICILKNGEHCACKIVEHLGLPQNLVSHHLNKLKGAGLITGRKEGIWIHYSLTDEGKKIAENIFNILK